MEGWLKVLFLQHTMGIERPSSHEGMLMVYVEYLHMWVTKQSPAGEHFNFFLVKGFTPFGDQSHDDPICAPSVCQHALRVRADGFQQSKECSRLFPVQLSQS